MLGPTSLRPCATLSSSLVNTYCLSIALFIMNILSTPIANIKKGITSALIIVKPTPRREISPIDDSTDARTIKIPIIARVNPELIFEGNTPIATPM
jgi:hypothetical protein